MIKVKVESEFMNVTREFKTQAKRYTEEKTPFHVTPLKIDITHE